MTTNPQPSLYGDDPHLNETHITLKTIVFRALRSAAPDGGQVLPPPPVLRSMQSMAELITCAIMAHVQVARTERQYSYAEFEAWLQKHQLSGKPPLTSAQASAGFLAETQAPQLLKVMADNLMTVPGAVHFRVWPNVAAPLVQHVQGSIAMLPSKLSSPPLPASALITPSQK